VPWSSCGIQLLWFVNLSHRKSQFELGHPRWYPWRYAVMKSTFWWVNVGHTCMGCKGWAVCSIHPSLHHSNSWHSNIQCCLSKQCQRQRRSLKDGVHLAVPDLDILYVDQYRRNLVMENWSPIIHKLCSCAWCFYSTLCVTVEWEVMCYDQSYWWFLSRERVKYQSDISTCWIVLMINCQREG
jgi:hypothetical protein